MITMHVYIAPVTGNPVLRCCTVLLSLTQICFDIWYLSNLDDNLAAAEDRTGLLTTTTKKTTTTTGEGPLFMTFNI